LTPCTCCLRVVCFVRGAAAITSGMQPVDVLPVKGCLCRCCGCCCGIARWYVAGRGWIDQGHAATVPCGKVSCSFCRMQFSEGALRDLLAAYGQAPCLPESASCGGCAAAGSFGSAEAPGPAALRTQLGRFIGLRQYYGTSCLDQHGRPTAVRSRQALPVSVSVCLCWHRPLACAFVKSLMGSCACISWAAQATGSGHRLAESLPQGCIFCIRTVSLTNILLYIEAGERMRYRGRRVNRSINVVSQSLGLANCGISKGYASAAATDCITPMLMLRRCRRPALRISRHQLQTDAARSRRIRCRSRSTRSRSSSSSSSSSVRRRRCSSIGN